MAEHDPRTREHKAARPVPLPMTVVVRLAPDHYTELRKLREAVERLAERQTIVVCNCKNTTVNVPERCDPAGRGGAS